MAMDLVAAERWISAQVATSSSPSLPGITTPAACRAASAQPRPQPAQTARPLTQQLRRPYPATVPQTSSRRAGSGKCGTERSHGFRA